MPSQVKTENIFYIIFSADPTGPGPCALILTGISAILILLTLPLSLIACVKVTIINQSDRTICVL